MSKNLLADLVLMAHLGYVSFVIFGYLAVLAGGAQGWGWVRNRLFRLLHVAAIAFVALEGLLGVVCPLTWLEDLLRQQGGQGSFVGRFVLRVMYYDFPPWAFTALYVALTLLALWLWRRWPPRRKGQV